MEILKLFLRLSAFIFSHTSFPLHTRPFFLPLLLFFWFFLAFSFPVPIFFSQLPSLLLSLLSDSLLLVLLFSPSGCRVSTQMKVGLWASVSYSGPRHKKGWWRWVRNPNDCLLPLAPIWAFPCLVSLCSYASCCWYIYNGWVFILCACRCFWQARPCLCCFLCFSFSLHLFLERVDTFYTIQMAFIQIMFK